LQPWSSPGIWNWRQYGGATKEGVISQTAVSVKTSPLAKINIGRMGEEKMSLDYDLSKLPASQADLWIYLQADAILTQIMAEQAARLGFPSALGDCMASALANKPQGIFNNG
jgi:hypothetical protein